MTYQDFIIRVRDYQEISRKEASFKVEIVESPLGRQVKPQQTTYNAEMMRNQSSNLRITEQRRLKSGTELIRIGKWLAESLLPPSILFWLKASLFQAIIRRQGLRIILWLDDPEAAQLPWEYLYVSMPTFEVGFLALNPLTPILRDQGFFGFMESIEVKTRRRALLGIAEPDTLSDLDDFTGRRRAEALDDDLGGTAKT
jgi:hypothetical protein